MKLAIYGYNNKGIEIESITNHYLNDDHVSCFVESDFSKIDLNAKIPVITPFRLKSFIDQNLIDAIIIPEYPEFEFRDIIHIFQDAHIDFSMLYFTSINIFKKNAQEFHSFRQLLYREKHILPYLTSLDFEVSESCNLKCKRCNHFSNLIENDCFADYDIFLKDLKRLSNLFEGIGTFYLLGGEPLLNDYLDQYIFQIHKLFPDSSIIIITNGILLRQISDCLIKTIKDTGAIVSVSLYPPLYHVADELFTFLHQKGIQFSCFNYIREFSAFINPEGDSNASVAVRSCLTSFSHAFKNGKIYKCCIGMNVRQFNQATQMNLPEVGLDLYGNFSPLDLKHYLLLPNALCNYCTTSEMKPWERSDETTCKEDWFSSLKLR
jgi:hypothetical protein